METVLNKLGNQVKKDLNFSRKKFFFKPDLKSINGLLEAIQQAKSLFN